MMIWDTMRMRIENLNQSINPIINYLEKCRFLFSFFKDKNFELTFITIAYAYICISDDIDDNNCMYSSFEYIFAYLFFITR